MYMYVYVFCVTLFIMHILKIKHIIGESKPMDSEYSAITVFPQLTIDFAAVCEEECDLVKHLPL